MADELKNENGESMDIISGLPDSILHHILSFLPSKDVISTMILSRRWKLLWGGVSCFDFDQRLHFDSARNYCPIKHSRFMNFVDRVLLLSHGTSIDKFRLFFLCYDIFSDHDVESWFSTVVSRNVQNIDIFMFAKRPFSLSCSSIFGCQSLRILSLSICCTLQLPSHISLPNLEVLELSLFSFPDAKSLENLFSSCPVLEELCLSGCEWIHMNTITISILTLKNLSMREYHPLQGTLGGNHSACYIIIEAPELLSFTYKGSLINQFYLSKLSSSVMAFIDATPTKDLTIKAPRLVNLVNALENMIFLMISGLTLELLFSEDIVSNHLPVFRHLEHIQLCIRLKNRFVRGLVKFLNCLPKLSMLQFSQAFDSRKIISDDVQMPPAIHLPSGFLPSLECLAFHDFCGGTCELFLLKSFLENVVSLQKIHIFQSHGSIINPENQKLWRDEVENLSTRFKNCEIIVQ